MARDDFEDRIVHIRHVLDDQELQEKPAQGQTWALLASQLADTSVLDHVYPVSDTSPRPRSPRPPAERPIRTLGRRETAMSRIKFWFGLVIGIALGVAGDQAYNRNFEWIISNQLAFWLGVALAVLFLFFLFLTVQVIRLSRKVSGEKEKKPSRKKLKAVDDDDLPEPAEFVNAGG